MRCVVSGHSKPDLADSHSEFGQYLGVNIPADEQPNDLHRKARSGGSSPGSAGLHPMITLAASSCSCLCITTGAPYGSLACCLHPWRTNVARLVRRCNFPLHS